MQNQFNFLLLYIVKFRQISSNDALEMMERYADNKFRGIKIIKMITWRNNELSEYLKKKSAMQNTISIST